MIDLNDAKYNQISKEELLNKYSEYDIFRHYFGDFQLGETYRSPLRAGDNTPSFNIFYSRRTDCLLFKDFAGKRGDCIRFVQYLLALPSYQDAIQQISKDMALSYSIVRPPEVHVSKSRAVCDIKIAVREWQDRDSAYWSQYGISRPTLRLYNVVPIEGYYQNEKYFETKDIAYAYLEYKDEQLTYKIYRPTASKDKKWRNNNPFGVHQGYRQLPFSGECMIITKSLKDVMSIWECTDIPAIGVQSETCFIKDSVIEEYKMRFDNLYTLFDNDRQGREQAASYEKLYDIPFIFIPDGHGAKDFSDLVKLIGRHYASVILKSLVK